MLGISYKAKFHFHPPANGDEIKIYPPDISSMGLLAARFHMRMLLRLIRLL
jgi:hypothetical protein